MLGITEVIENLYISGLESRQTILSKGIRCVFNISSECPTQDLGPNIEYEKVALLDLPTTSIQPYFDRLTDQIHNNLQQGKKTLVHCYVGRSRSATIILAYLMKYKQMPLREAFHYLKSRRHIVGPNFGFIRQLINYERSLFGYTSVSFVNTSFGSVPDIYLSMASNKPRRQISTMHIPIQAVHSNPVNFQRNPSSTVQRSSSVNANQLNSSNTNRNSLYFSTTPTVTLGRTQPTASVNRTLSPRATTTLSTYTSAYNPGANQKTSRPASSSFTYQNSNATVATSATAIKPTQRSTYELTRAHSSLARSNEPVRDSSSPTRVNSFRTVKYIPSSYNRYYL